MSLIRLSDVHYKNILDNINLEINKNDYISIIGSSGSGKSTLLRLIAYLDNPSMGEICFYNKHYTQYNPIELRKSISYCFQNPILLGKTVNENFEYVYSVNNLQYDYNEIISFLRLFDLEENILKKDNINLSGGEIQRISLIRNLILNPKVLLLDEITSALDEKNTMIVMDVLKELNKNITIIQIIHDINLAKLNADYLIEIESGKIIKKERLK